MVPAENSASWLGPCDGLVERGDFIGKQVDHVVQNAGAVSITRGDEHAADCGHKDVSLPELVSGQTAPGRRIDGGSYPSGHSRLLSVASWTWSWDDADEPGLSHLRADFLRQFVRDPQCIHARP